MNTKIRKIRSTAVPTPSRAQYGPATAGVEWDTAIDALVVNPDGTRRTLTQSILVNITVAAGAAQVEFDGTGFIAPFPVELISARERHGTAGAAANIRVVKVPSGTAKGAGNTDMITTGFSAAAVADTNQVGALAATVANRRLATGDAAMIFLSAASAALDAVTITLEFKRRDV